MTADLGPKLNTDACKAGCKQNTSYLGREQPYPAIFPFSKSEAYLYFVVAIQSEHSNSASVCTSIQRTQPSKAFQYLSIIHLFVKRMSESEHWGIQQKSAFSYSASSSKKKGA